MPDHIQRIKPKNAGGVGHQPHPKSRVLSGPMPTDYHLLQALKLYIREKVHGDKTSLENDFHEFLNSHGQDFHPVA
ncbi:hypothetical protein M514_21031 [Trichuris suis]|uniref:Uncharacterized protein n=1 Tax=Trichuris suis TaxID=68888 RepID=A0A085MLG7_9BILA|nr:hypothetical protein M513_02364 [Trichuris suis]KFD58063.1 hypothetical protein M513_00826 [Trichuris suis]KFD66887.1 hypothetical protein M514_21031 [Trichuris suis]KHJ44511.1 hypothetical protein D918_05176 [Trichuris suis]